MEPSKGGFMVAFLGLFGCRRLRGPVDGFMEDRVVRIVLFHGSEVVWAFNQVLTLAGRVFRADGLAVEALRGEALWQNVSTFQA